MKGKVSVSYLVMLALGLLVVLLLASLAREWIPMLGKEFINVVK